MSYDFAPNAARRAVLAGLMLTAALISGCQVRPLYREEEATGKALAAVEYADATDRITQVLRNQLIFLTGGGAGETKMPEYRVQLATRTWSTEVLVEKTSDINRTGTIFVSATYSLTRLSDGKVLKTGQRQSHVLVYWPIQEFATIRAIRDGQDRAAKDLAEIIRADIATVLGR